MFCFKCVRTFSRIHFGHPKVFVLLSSIFFQCFLYARCHFGMFNSKISSKNILKSPKMYQPYSLRIPPFKTNFRFLKGGYSYKKFHFWNFYFQTQSICFFSISDKNLAKNLKYEWNIAIQCNFQRNALRKLQLLENISSKSSKKFVYKGDVFEIGFHNS